MFKVKEETFESFITQHVKVKKYIEETSPAYEFISTVLLANGDNKEFAEGFVFGICNTYHLLRMQDASFEVKRGTIESMLSQLMANKLNFDDLLETIEEENSYVYAFMIDVIEANPCTFIVVGFMRQGLTPNEND